MKNDVNELTQNCGERGYSCFCITSIFIITHSIFAFTITVPIATENPDFVNEGIYVLIVLVYVIGLLFLMSYIRLETKSAGSDFYESEEDKSLGRCKYC